MDVFGHVSKLVLRGRGVAFLVASAALWIVFRGRRSISNFQVLRKIRGKMTILNIAFVKIGGILARNIRFEAPTCVLLSLWLSCGIAVSVGEAAKILLLADVKVSKLEEVSRYKIQF